MIDIEKLSDSELEVMATRYESIRKKFRDPASESSEP
jgi:hypothetical protein